jgi:hypothetical protein
MDADRAPKPLNNEQDEYYTRKFDAYKPKFKGIPPNYYVNTWGNIALIWFLILLSYAVCAGIFAGLVTWGMYNTETAVYTYVGVFLAYVLIMIIGVYFGSRVRARKEKQMIEDKLREQAEEAQKAMQTNIKGAENKM